MKAKQHTFQAMLQIAFSATVALPCVYVCASVPVCVFVGVCELCTGMERFTAHRLLPKFQHSTTALIVGGNTGRDTLEFLTRFPHLRRVYVFEPIPSLASALEVKFAGDNRVTVLPFGVDGQPGTQVC